MYNPLGLEQQRLDQAQLRRRAACTACGTTDGSATPRRLRRLRRS